MIVIAFLTVYSACTALLIAVVWQDRRRAAERQARRDPRATPVPEFIFRTQA